MIKRIGIRREDKSKFERRVPLVPQDVARLVSRGVSVMVQPSDVRVFKDAEYENVGAVIQEDLSDCEAVFAVKEIPLKCIDPGVGYFLFPHVIKGQASNMPMLASMMEKGCSLFDYELIKGTAHAVGYYAGVVGVVEALVALAGRLQYEGIKSPFDLLRQPYLYDDDEDVYRDLRKVGAAIARDGLPKSIAPMIIGICGYGNCSTGVQEMLKCLPCEWISPDMISEVSSKPAVGNKIYATVFHKPDMYRRVSGQAGFDLEEFNRSPELYESRLPDVLPKISVLFNCIFWHKKSPHLVTKRLLKDMYSPGNSGFLRVIADISCDTNGGIECTDHGVAPNNPVYTYLPESDETRDGVKGAGPVIMAVDHLPCEMADKTSSGFSKALMALLEQFEDIDIHSDLSGQPIPEMIARCQILCKGALTDRFKYLSDFL